MDATLVPVRVGACLCPGAPHADGDFVYLAPHIGFRGGLLAEATIVRVWTALDTSGKVPSQTDKSLELEAALREIYVRYGVKAWTFLDAEGEEIEVNDDSIAEILLTNFTLARPVGDKADELYTSSVLDPLLARLSKSSRPSRTNGSTSVRKPSSAKPPKLLKPSSTTTTDKGLLTA